MKIACNVYNALSYNQKSIFDYTKYFIFRKLAMEIDGGNKDFCFSSRREKECKVTHVIEDLTEEEKEKFPPYIEEWKKIGLSTERQDWKVTEDYMEELYDFCGYKKPKIEVVNSPLEIYKFVKEYDKKHKLETSPQDFLSALIYGNHEAAWLAFYDFYRNIRPNTPDIDKVKYLINISKNCGWFFPGEEIAICSERPTIINMDDKDRLHSFTEPAIGFADGWNEYAIRGVSVPEMFVKDPASIRVDMITEEKNAEIKRIMVDLFGHERYIKESGASLIHEDKFGKLYRADLGDGQDPLMMVEVSDPYPSKMEGEDGIRKHYFLRVPHDEKVDPFHIIKGEMKRAKQAVAWTFKKKEHEYKPVFET